MNMGDNVASATLQVSGKVVDVGGHLSIKLIDAIAKLFQAMITKAKADRAEKKVKSRDLTDLKPGTVSIKQLKKNAQRTGDQIVFSQQGLTKADKSYISAKAGQYGIPVAFTQNDGKDNIFAQVRKSDLPVFQQICTDMMKDKLAERPQSLGNFKINEWEMPFITNELNNYDLSASFGMTRDGERFCLYEKADEKAILIARGEFRRKCAEVEGDLSFTKSEDGFYTLKSANSGEEISFDELPAHDELADQIQQKFGYDDNKSQIACGKFSEEMLNAEEKTRFFSEDPQREFSNISGFISVDGEDVRCKEFTCWRITPKMDEIPRIVFRDTDGNFAVLEPEKLSAKQMQDTLRESLNIEDTATLNALTDKAQKVSDHYISEQNAVLDADFQKSSFDMTNPTVVEGMRRTDDDGHTYTKSQPVDSVHNEINRTDKDSFTVKSSVNSTELDESGTECCSTDTRELVLSFSDKKNAIAELKEMYKDQGIPDHAAIAMAKDVFARAKAQPPEKVVLLEEVRAETIKVSFGGQDAQIPIADRNKATADICDKFGVSKEVSEQILSRAEQHKEAAVAQAEHHAATGRTLEDAKQNVAAHQAQKTDFNTAINRMTDRGVQSVDTMIICSAQNPQSYIRACSHKNSIKNHSRHDDSKKNNIKFIITSTDFAKTL